MVSRHSSRRPQFEQFAQKRCTSAAQVGQRSSGVGISRLKAVRRDTPQVVQLTAHTNDLFDAQAVLAWTQAGGFSAQLGRERTTMTRQRLSRAGLDRLGLGVLTRSELESFRVTDEPISDDWFGRFSFRYKPWAKITFYEKDARLRGAPPTDLVQPGSATLLFDRTADRRLDLCLNPFDDFGVDFRL